MTRRSADVFPPALAHAGAEREADAAAVRVLAPVAESFARLLARLVVAQENRSTD